MLLVERLEANSTWEPNSGCRIWLGALNKEHGVIKVGGKQDGVHRVAWELEKGRIPRGMHVMHTCGLAACFNVNHLRLGTRLENRRDLNRPGGYEFFSQHGSNVPRARVPVSTAPMVRMPKQSDPPLSQSEVVRTLSYNPITGEFRHRSRSDRDHTWNMRFSGEVAGSVQGNGYRYLIMGPKHYLAHRIAWLWVTGELPESQVDHINCDRTDNRWANLRCATQKQNSANQKLRSTNTSGVKGVSWAAGKKKWQASITVDGKTIALGRFDTLAEAAEARRLAESQHHGAFAHIAGNA